MNKKPKAYFLPLDVRHKLRALDVVRPGREIRKILKVENIEKEETKVLSARISEPTYRRLRNFVQRKGGSKKPESIGHVVEEAVLFWIAFEYRHARQVILCCSEQRQAELNRVLGDFRRKRRQGSVAPGSRSYKYSKTGPGALVSLPRLRPQRLERRLQDLVQLLRLADEGFTVLNSWTEPKPLLLDAIISLAE